MTLAAASSTSRSQPAAPHSTKSRPTMTARLAALSRLGVAAVASSRGEHQSWACPEPCPELRETEPLPSQQASRSRADSPSRHPFRVPAKPFTPVRFRSAPLPRVVIWDEAPSAATRSASAAASARGSSPAGPLPAGADARRRQRAQREVHDPALTPFARRSASSSPASRPSAGGSIGSGWTCGGTPGSCAAPSRAARCRADGSAPST